MNAIARLVTKRAKWVLLTFIAVIAALSFWGLQSFGQLKSGGYDNPGSDSAVVARLLDTKFHHVKPDITLVAQFKDSADTPESSNIAQALKIKLTNTDGVAAETDYYSLGWPASLRSTDGRSAYFFVYAEPKADTVELAKRITQLYDGWFHGARVYVTGAPVVSSAISGTIQHDIAIAEEFAVPLTVLLLILAFGSLVSSLLPFVVAVVSALGAFFVLYLVSCYTDTSIFGVNLVTGMALGLGVDYALLMVNRFREERAKNQSIEAAVTNTILTAGRTVLFSGLTIAVSVMALAFFPQYFLRTFAVAGVGVVIFAIAASLLLLPSLLMLLGKRVDSLKVWRGSLAPKNTGAWEKISRSVMRRPLPVLFVSLVILSGLVSLGRGVQFGLVDDRILPESSKTVQAGNVVRTQFDGREGTPIEIILGHPSKNQLIKYTTELSKLAGIVRVQSPAGITQNGQLDPGYAQQFATYNRDGLTRVDAITNVDSHSTAAYELTGKVRNLQTAVHYVRVGGAGASYTDALNGVFYNLPWALLWLTVTTLLLLFLFTGSILLPIKAVLLNLLSLSATLGFLTWIFQDGHLHWLLGPFITTGTVDISTMVLVAVIAFGLSMDYELFMLSRIKEQHLAGYSTVESVAFGLQRSGRIITTAALVLAVSFYGFTTSSVSIMKLLGIGVAFAILLDATLVRALLVPALMRLFGEYNWWAPKWLQRLYHRAGLEH
jgi:RND superfamily putative drug exporter